MQGRNGEREKGWISGNKAAVIPALGMAWSSMVTVRLMLSRTEQLVQVCVDVCSNRQENRSNTVKPRH